PVADRWNLPKTGARPVNHTPIRLALSRQDVYFDWLSSRNSLIQRAVPPATAAGMATKFRMGTSVARNTKPPKELAKILRRARERRINGKATPRLSAGKSTNCTAIIQALNKALTTGAANCTNGKKPSTKIASSRGK